MRVLTLSKGGELTNLLRANVFAQRTFTVSCEKRNESITPYAHVMRLATHIARTCVRGAMLMAQSARLAR